jgi:hypothetical protein
VFFNSNGSLEAGLAISYCALELVFAIFSAKWEGSNNEPDVFRFGNMISSFVGRFGNSKYSHVPTTAQ